MTLTEHAIPTTSGRQRPALPERLVSPVVTHLLRTYANWPGPSMMGLEGPTGSGKSHSLGLILDWLEVVPLKIPCGQLESPEAGLPAARIERAHQKAVRIMKGQPTRSGAEPNEPRPAALILEDLDCSLGNWGEMVQSTVNRQTAVGALMHLADSHSQDRDGDNPRVPIIITGNDFTKLYLPLRRYGRMDILKWIPTPAEKRDMIRRIFPEIGDAVARLQGAFPNEPIAFFADVRRRWDDEQLKSAVNIAGGPRKALRAALGGFPLMGRVPKMTPDRLLELAARLRRDSNSMNYLEGSSS